MTVVGGVGGEGGFAHLGVAVHVTVPDKTPSEHEYVPVPVWTYAGVLHSGVHELPLARLDGHVPRAPFVGAVIVQGLGMHTAVLVVSVPAVHACTFRTSAH